MFLNYKDITETWSEAGGNGKKGMKGSFALEFICSGGIDEHILLPVQIHLITNTNTLKLCKK